LRKLAINVCEKTSLILKMQLLLSAVLPFLLIPKSQVKGLVNFGPDIMIGANANQLIKTMTFAGVHPELSFIL